MPGFVGAVKVNSFSGGAVFNVGDVYRIAPRSSTKTFAGAGSFNTGAMIKTETHKNNTITYDADAVDQGIVDPDVIF